MLTFVSLPVKIVFDIKLILLLVGYMARSFAACGRIPIDRQM
jgi:hypothetical protein